MKIVNTDLTERAQSFLLAEMETVNYLATQEGKPEVFPSDMPANKIPGYTGWDRSSGRFHVRIGFKIEREVGRLNFHSGVITYVGGSPKDIPLLPIAYEIRDLCDNQNMVLVRPVWDGLDYAEGWTLGMSDRFLDFCGVLRKNEDELWDIVEPEE